MQHAHLDLNIETAFSPTLQVGGCPGEAVHCSIVPSHSNVNSKLTISPPRIHIR